MIPLPDGKDFPTTLRRRAHTRIHIGVDEHRFKRPRPPYLRKYLTGLYLPDGVKNRPHAAVVVFIDGVNKEDNGKRWSDRNEVQIQLRAARMGTFSGPAFQCALDFGSLRIDSRSDAMLESLGIGLKRSIKEKLALLKRR